MALDRYQAMFAIATYNGAIKIFNLKGYEQDIPLAHEHPINFLLFVPNKGKLMSIDTSNCLKIWDLQDLSCLSTQSVPQPPEVFVTCFYMPQELTTKNENHRHAFIGMLNGDLYILDTDSQILSPYFVLFNHVMGNLAKPDAIADIKCNP
jgi:WD40 repeat protein